MAKKTKSKERLDKFYRIAKEQGFRSRAAFKLIQLNKRYNFLEGATVLVDLCAAPGGWLQVAAQTMPSSSIIVGVDLDSIKSIAGTLTFQEDITTESCLQRLRKELKHLKADVVLHDGAPNVGSNWSKDAYNQSELCLAAVRLATRLLRPGGVFVTKVFRSTDYLSLRQALGRMFRGVEANKPEASRAMSAEIFLVCTGFMGLERVQAAWLDPLQVFARTERDVFEEGQRIDSLKKVFEQGKHRAIPDDTPSTMFRRLSLQDFLVTANPYKVFVEFNCLISSPDELATLDALVPLPTDLSEMIADLKLLNKTQMRVLLKWRQKVNNIRAKQQKKDKKPQEKQAPPIASLENPLPTALDDIVAEIEPLQLRETFNDSVRRNEKDLLRRAKKNLQRGGDPNAMPIDDELGEFDFTKFTKSFSQAKFIDLEALNDATLDRNRRALDSRSRPEALTEMEDNLEFLYEQRQKREKERKKVEMEKVPKRRERIETLGTGEINQMRSQSPWFEREIFNGLKTGETVPLMPPPEALPQEDDFSDSSEEEQLAEDHKLNLERPAGIRPSDTEEAAELIALSRKMMRKKSRREILDQAYNRYNYPEDPSTLPKWFADDQRKAVGKIPQVTKEDIQREREKLQLLSNRLPMKVIEAKYRKKKRLLNRLDRAKTEAQEVLDNDTLTPLLKGKELKKIYGKALKAGKAPRKKLVVSRRFTTAAPRSKSGRKYKTVDKRLKKDMRAQKKINKRDRRKK